MVCSNIYNLHKLNNYVKAGFLKNKMEVAITGEIQ